ncbi:hypothetical protein MIZ03_2975 [Rhodoferax lithotrophicus]|uniref:Uncharacterized protein n=1 Tax=Rhodoferax lithotrophicus TaxID=2798804 RepID=A0ABN6D7R6_9BURK|nr:hypothetical protein MIZ03_2975 [Rhodoferax sp. MIZ03]
MVAKGVDVTDVALAHMARIHSVGARGMVHMPQFNGKQGGAQRSKPNLRCPRNGK